MRSLLDQFDRHLLYVYKKWLLKDIILPQNVCSRLPQGVIIFLWEAVIHWGRFQMAIQGQENPSHLKVVCTWLTTARGTVNENQLLWIHVHWWSPGWSTLDLNVYITIQLLLVTNNSTKVVLWVNLFPKVKFGLSMDKIQMSNYSFLKGDREAGRRSLLPFTAKSKKYIITKKVFF